MTVDREIIEAESRRAAGGTPVRVHAGGTTILCGLWVAVIVLAVAIDLAK